MFTRGTQQRFVGAVEEGDLQVLEWCKGDDCLWSPVVASIATLCGNLGNVRGFVVNEGHDDIHCALCCRTTEGGKLEVVPVDSSERTSQDGKGSRLFDASGDNLEILTWHFTHARPTGNTEGRAEYAFDGTGSTLARATENGFLCVLLRSSLDTFYEYGAGRSNLEVLYWCRCVKRCRCPSSWRYSS